MVNIDKNLLKKIEVPIKYRKVLLEQDEEYDRFLFNAARCLDIHLYDNSNEYLYSDEYKNAVSRLLEQQNDCNKAILGIILLILEDIEGKDIKPKIAYIEKEKEAYDTLYYML